MPPIGSHATVTGGVATGGLAYASAVAAEVIQVFVSNPRGWAAGPGDPGEDARLRDSQIPVFVHATYMINLGSGNPEVAARSADAVAHALRRGADIGARGVVVHTGSAAGWAARAAGEDDARDRALRQIGAGQIGTTPFRELLAAMPGVPFMVETPGGKTGHARDIATLKGLRAR